MSLTEKLSSIKSGIEALLNYANQKTEASDPTLGDAVRTLVDGYGSGGGIEWVPVTSIPSGRSFSIDIGEVDRCVVLLHLVTNIPCNGGMGYNDVARNIMNIQWTCTHNGIGVIIIDNNKLKASQISFYDDMPGIRTSINQSLVERVRTIQPHWINATMPATGGYLVIPY